MCGGDAPQDNSAEVARIEAQAAREAAEREEARKAQERADFDARLNAAFGTGTDSAAKYFQSQGLDVDEYMDEIQSAATRKRGEVPLLDASPATYFANLGQEVYGSEQDAMRNRYMRGIDSVAPTGFATRRIDDTVDDATIEAILAEQYQTGENYIRNLLDRGVITNSGYSGAQKNLEGQRAGAKSRLNEVGLGIINKGRGDAENLVNTDRSQVSSMRLGTQYDPFELGTRLNNQFTDFFAGLGDKFRAASPKNLFDTSGLAGIAGASQGAGNTAFNPQAIAGIGASDNEDDDENIFEQNVF